MTRKRIEHKTVDNVELKLCGHCKEWKELGCFYKRKNTLDGLNWQCKKCNNQNCKQYRIDNAELFTWRRMIYRCTNPKNKRYKDYGGRGITVCDRWLNSFENFLEDMGRKPNSELTLERINNDKGYYKENCKWATSKEQANNRRPFKPITSGPKKQFWFCGYGPNGEEIVDNNQKHIAKLFELNQGNISNCLYEKRKTHKGWRFKKI